MSQISLFSHQKLDMSTWEKTFKIEGLLIVSFCQILNFFLSNQKFIELDWCLCWVFGSWTMLCRCCERHAMICLFPVCCNKTRLIKKIWCFLDCVIHHTVSVYQQNMWKLACITCILLWTWFSVHVCICLPDFILSHTQSALCTSQEHQILKEILLILHLFFL